MLTQIYEVASAEEAAAMSEIGIDSKTKTDRAGTHTKDLEKVRAFHTLAQDRRSGSDAAADL